MKSSYKTRMPLGFATSAALAIVIGVAVTILLNHGVNKLPIRQYFPQTQTNAIWDWSNITHYQADTLRSTADFLYMHQINTVYVDIGSYAVPASGQTKDEHAQQLRNLNASLERYIAAMDARHIRVFAAGGNTDWSKPDQQDIPLAIQQYVFSYNQTHTQGLAGIEFDIESYNQTNFAKASFTEKSLVLSEYLDVVDRVVSAQTNYHKQYSNDPIELGFAIPYWFDNENQNIQSVTWHDKTGPVLYHLLDRLNSLPKANVDVMAYRNAALGNDGMVYHARTEVDYARARAPHVKVLIGMEMNNVEPAKITFYGQSYTQVTSQEKLLSSEFGMSSGFGGIAINDVAGYMAMNNKNDVNTRL